MKDAGPGPKAAAGPGRPPALSSSGGRKVRTREEAIGWAERYGAILGDGELEVGKVNERWDIGLMPAPENPPLQVLLIEKADQATEGGRPNPAADGLDEAMDLCRRYAEILGGTLEIDLRLVDQDGGAA